MALTLYVRMPALPSLRKSIHPTRVFLACAVAWLAFCPPAHSLSFVKDGKPDAVLVVPDDVRLVEQYAAQEFQLHALKASGMPRYILVLEGF